MRRYKVNIWELLTYMIKHNINRNGFAAVTALHNIIKPVHCSIQTKNVFGFQFEISKKLIELIHQENPFFSHWNDFCFKIIPLAFNLVK
jgi:NurA-like 5'-3' nuclease